jgi:hypothetical protein
VFLVHLIDGQSSLSSLLSANMVCTTPYSPGFYQTLLREREGTRTDFLEPPIGSG